METNYRPKLFRGAGRCGLGRALIGAFIAAMVTSGIVSGTVYGAAPGMQLPPAGTDAAASERQAQAFIEALTLRPQRPGKPVIAVLALNEGTEITDFLLTHALLRRAGVADVQAVAPRRGLVALYPALQVEVPHDFADFDREHPSGADYVIVPALRDDDDPAIIAWLQRQAGQGARIIGICAGALVLGRAGLLDGRRFTTHWYYRKTLLERHPGATYVPNQRYVIDRGIATTTGITASMPAMLALVQAIGGPGKAQRLATELGVASWTPAHDSTLFGLNASRASTYLLNKLAFWRHQDWRVDVGDGMDDISLALAADAWSRTGHVSLDATSATGPVTLRSGLVLRTQPATEDRPRLPLSGTLNATQQLRRTLCEIGERYGASLRDWVMIEMEYSRAPDNCQQ